jgi:hypothetical protein
MSYVPRSDSEFDAFFSNFLEYVTPKVTSTPPQWPHIPIAAVTALSGLYDVWVEAYAKTKGPHTSVDTTAKNDAKAAGTKSLDEFITRYLLWPPVTDVDLAALMIHLKDKIRTPSEKPTIHVGFALKIHQLYEIEIDFWVLETGKHHVPRNMNGVVLYTLVSDTPITNQADLHNTRLLTKHTNVLTFPPEQQGKMLYVACCWENRRGVEGDWSAIQSIRIP